MKRIVSLFLTLVIVCSCMAASVFAAPESFRDVASDAYYHEAVLWAVQQGITAGVGENKFGPNNPCTRDQIMTMLWRAAGSPGHQTAESAFTDVSQGDYFYDAVLWAVENGVTAGVGNNKFGPSNPCTRAQIVTFLWKARGSQEPTNTANQFTDVASDAYYAKAVAWAVENKVTSGVGNNHFGPDETCTRAQIVTFLWKADQITPSENPDTCAHEDILIERIISEDDILLDFVRDTFQCSKCGYKHSIYHEIVSEDITSDVIAQEEQRAVDALNQYRAENGLSQLSQSPVYDSWADIRSEELATQFSHQRPNGGIVDFYEGNDCVYGENISYGFGSGVEAVNNFKSSPQHNGWMLLPDLTGVSVSIYVNENNTYVAMLLIGPRN